MDERSATPRLVLGSASPRRAALLARLGLRPVIRPAAIDEAPRPQESATVMVQRLADAKARVAGRAQGDDEVVLAADTVVELDGRVLGKPSDQQEAARMLHALAGRTHTVFTGVVVRRATTRFEDVVATRVRMRALSDDEVRWYIGTGEPAGKAGAYALQGAGAALVAAIDGSDTNVIGLPLAETVILLRRAGLDPLRPT